MEQPKIPTPQAVIGKMTVRHAVKKAEQQRKEELSKWQEKGFSSQKSYALFLKDNDLKKTKNSNLKRDIVVENSRKKIEANEAELLNWKEKGFASKEDYAIFLMAEEKKEIKNQQIKMIANDKSGKMTAKKALALLAVGGISALGAGFVLNKKAGELTDYGNSVIDTEYMPNIDVDVPISGKIDPQVFEDIVKSSKYQKKVGAELEFANNSVAELKEDLTTQVNPIKSELNNLFSKNGISESSITTTSGINTSSADGKTINFKCLRGRNESLTDWIIRGNQEFSGNDAFLEQLKQEHAEKIFKESEKISMLFEQNGIEKTYENLANLHAFLDFDTCPPNNDFFDKARLAKLYPDCFSEEQMQARISKPESLPDGVSQELVDFLTEYYKNHGVVIPNKNDSYEFFVRFPNYRKLLEANGFEADVNTFRDALNYVTVNKEVYPECYEWQTYYIKLKDTPLEEVHNQILQMDKPDSIYKPCDVEGYRMMTNSFDRLKEKYINAFEGSDQERVRQLFEELENAQTSYDQNIADVWNNYVSEIGNIQESMVDQWYANYDPSAFSMYSGDTTLDNNVQDMIVGDQKQSLSTDISIDEQSSNSIGDMLSNLPLESMAKISACALAGGVALYAGLKILERHEKSKSEKQANNVEKKSDEMQL